MQVGVSLLDNFAPVSREYKALDYLAEDSQKRSKRNPINHDGANAVRAKHVFVFEETKGAVGLFIGEAMRQAHRRNSARHAQG